MALKWGENSMPVTTYDRNSETLDKGTESLKGEGEFQKSTFGIDFVSSQPTIELPSRIWTRMPI
jgi:hypothetical protein